MGLVVAMLSVTGVYIWYKKRLARLRAQWIRSERPIATGDAMPQPSSFSRS
jgi:uncharacterized iron-regulated membrane protein